MSFEKQFADVFFDDEQGVYRGSVEYYSDEHASPVVVSVEFPGEKSMTFEDLERHAFKTAEEILRAIVGP